jgi:hypothetical protein
MSWRKSSFSGSNGGSCIEVSSGLGTLRDSKNPAGPVLAAQVDLLVRHLKRS